jgi:hypothetical protein
MKTCYTVTVYITLENDPEDNEPEYSGRDVERMTLKTLRALEPRLNAIVDGELTDTESLSPTDSVSFASGSTRAADASHAALQSMLALALAKPVQS